MQTANCHATKFFSWKEYDNEIIIGREEGVLIVPPVKPPKRKWKQPVVISLNGIDIDTCATPTEAANRVNVCKRYVRILIHSGKTTKEGYSFRKKQQNDHAA